MKRVLIAAVLLALLFSLAGRAETAAVRAQFVSYQMATGTEPLSLLTKIVYWLRGIDYKALSTWVKPEEGDLAFAVNGEKINPLTLYYLVYPERMLLVEFAVYDSAACAVEREMELVVRADNGERLEGRCTAVLLPGEAENRVQIYGLLRGEPLADKLSLALYVDGQLAGDNTWE